MYCTPFPATDKDDTDSFGANRPQGFLFRNASPSLAVIFDPDDNDTYHNWRLKLGVSKQTSGQIKVKTQQPRFQEATDKECGALAFEMTGDHDGSVGMLCPPSSDAILAEELPYLNFIMTDLGGYSSIEICVTDDTGMLRVIHAKNFVARTCISRTRLEIPMRLRPSWNYATLDLRKLMRDAWNTNYQFTRLIKINTNFRIRQIYFSNRVYAYNELPRKFQMNLNVNPKTQLEIMDYEKAFPPTVKKLDLNLRPSTWVKRSLPLLTSSVIPPDTAETAMSQSLKDTSKGLRLSLPSNHELLSTMMSKSIHYKPETAPSILWKYPKRETKSYRGGIPGSGSTHGDPPHSSMTDDNTECPKDEEAQEDPQAVCDYIWKPSEDGQSAEWEKIEKSDVQPHTMAKIHKQRRGAGLYDIYNARMVQKDDLEYFGLEESGEKVKLIMKRKSEKADETFPRKSFVDENGDWDFFNYVVSGVGLQERRASEGSDDALSECGRSVGTDPCPQDCDDAWLLTLICQEIENGSDQVKKDQVSQTPKPKAKSLRFES